MELILGLPSRVLQWLMQGLFSGVLAVCPLILGGHPLFALGGASVVSLVVGSIRDGVLAASIWERVIAAASLNASGSFCSI